MKKFFSLLAVTFFCMASLQPVSAEVITPEVAKSTADGLLSLDTECVGGGEATVTPFTQDGTPVYYQIE